jgi:hypothetical protein
VPYERDTGDVDPGAGHAAAERCFEFPPEGSGGHVMSSERRSIMRNLWIAVLTGLALATPIAGLGAPDETQKLLIQRAQEAKQKLSAAQAAAGAQRQKMMQEHMKLMNDVMVQMRAGKPREGMTPQQMREWMDEQMKLMDQLMGQMMDEHHMMMQGMGK